MQKAVCWAKTWRDYLWIFRVPEQMQTMKQTAAEKWMKNSSRNDFSAFEQWPAEQLLVPTVIDQMMGAACTEVSCRGRAHPQTRPKWLNKIAQK